MFEFSAIGLVPDSGDIGLRIDNGLHISDTEQGLGVAFPACILLFHGTRVEIARSVGTKERCLHYITCHDARVRRVNNY